MTVALFTWLGLHSAVYAAADLVVTEIKLVSTTFNVNDSIQFDVTMKNQGSSATISSWLGYTIDVDGSYATWAGQNATLAAGASITIRSDWWKATKTTFSMTALADFPNYYPESNEGNNTFTSTYNGGIAGTDLVISEIKVVQIGVLAGDKINFDVTVKNQGTTASSSVWCGVYVYINGSYATWGGENISLSPGASIKMRTKQWVASSTSFTMGGLADFSNAVVESNKTNNWASQNYSSSAVLYQPSLTAGGWNLRWSDEFNVNGSPDPSKWGYEIGYIRNAEQQYFTNRWENARVEGGNLVIEARRENYNIQGAPNSYGATTANYTSASLITLGKAAWTFGRMDIRAKLPTARGIWPAFWTLGTNYGSAGWPRCGEIDILEHVGWDVAAAHTSIHTESRSHLTKNGYSVPTWITNLGSNYDLYSIEWEPSKIVFYINNRCVAQYDNDGTGESSWPFFRDQYLLLTLSVGGSWGGVEGVDEAAFPQKLLIDYVRVYQK